MWYLEKVSTFRLIEFRQYNAKPLPLLVLSTKNKFSKSKLCLIHPPKFRLRTRRRDLLLEPLLPTPSLYVGSQAHNSSKIWNSLVMVGCIVASTSDSSWPYSVVTWIFVVGCMGIVSSLFSISFPQRYGLHMRIWTIGVTCQFFPCTCALLIRVWFALQTIKIIFGNIFIKIYSNWDGIHC